MTEVDEEKARLMVSNKRAAADDRVSSFKVGIVFVGVGGKFASCFCGRQSQRRQCNAG